ncbi:MAG: tRNA (adenosine(37)-N6)-dimethylallyltransferase MiaA [Chloroflexi bacterium]|nr:tRNA (adenosine(37)-N6)-dimethylallyltransferase MiaA [Chloroflexota bacterium]
MLPIVALVGPTAVGKSALALKLAGEFDGEIVNADSRQFYRGLDIGTAKPTPEDLDSVPHHLIDCLDPHESMSLAAFVDLANAAIKEVSGRGRLPILVGGTGQYVWALVEAWDVPRVEPDQDLRAELEKIAESEGHQALEVRLRALDPEAADRIDSRNIRRVIRAIEVAKARSSEPPPSEAQKPELDALLIGLTASRAYIYERVDRRIDGMIANGWLSEVKELMANGDFAAGTASSSIGYRELVRHLKGDISLDEAIALTRKSTRRLVRHQYGWFKLSDKRIKWHDVEDKQASDISETVGNWISRGGLLEPNTDTIKT